jgi:hypothetical protein
MEENEIGAVDERTPPFARDAETEEMFCWN